MDRRTFLIRSAVLAGGALVAASLPAWAQKAIGEKTLTFDSDLYRRFSRPRNVDKPFVRWWWNGGKVTDAEILRELDLLKEAGIGGVEINVQESFTLEGVTIRPGVQPLNGTQAEKFVRERHSRGGDIGRINAQREFLSALVKKFKNLSMGQISALAPTLMNEVTTDLTVNDVLTLAPQVLKLDTSNMAFHMVPGEGAYANNLSVWGVHKQVLADLLNEYFRPFSDPVPAEELNILEIANTTDYYDDNDTTVGDLIGGGTSSGASGN